MGCAVENLPKSCALEEFVMEKLLREIGQATQIRIHNFSPLEDKPWSRQFWWAGLVWMSGGGGGGGGSSVDRARDSGWGGPGFDPRCCRPLPTGWVGVSIMWPAETEVMVSPLCLVCGSTYNCQTSVLGPVRDIALLLTRTLRNQPTKQTNKSMNI